MFFPPLAPNTLAQTTTDKVVLIYRVGSSIYLERYLPTKGAKVAWY